MLRITKRYRDMILHGTEEECENTICAFREDLKSECSIEVLDRFHSDISDMWIYIIKPVSKD